MAVPQLLGSTDVTGSNYQSLLSYSVVSISTQPLSLQKACQWIICGIVTCAQKEVLRASLSGELAVILHGHTGQLAAWWNLEQLSSACLVLSTITSWVYLFYCATYYKTKKNSVRPPSSCKCGRNWAVRLKLTAMGQTVQLQSVASLKNSFKFTLYHERVVPPNKSTSQEIFSQLSTPADK